MWSVPLGAPPPLRKGQEMLIHARTWVDIEDILVREISQSQKDRYYSSYLTHPESSDSSRREVGCQAAEKGRGGVTVWSVGSFSSWGEFCRWMAVMVALQVNVLM